MCLTRGTVLEVLTQDRSLDELEHDSIPGVVYGVWLGVYGDWLDLTVCEYDSMALFTGVAMHLFFSLIYD